MRACQAERWHLRLWKKGSRPGPDRRALRVRYLCKSWRHPGRCAVERSQEDASRIKAALLQHEPHQVMLLVLTFKPGEWGDESEAYRGIKDCWRSFAKAVRRQWGEMAYVSTVEKHRKGMPHLNAIVVCKGMAEDMRSMPRYVEQWVKDTADACGFGHQAFVDVARSREVVAGYIVKLADHVGRTPDEGKAQQLQLDGTVAGEVVKLTQLPVNAPKGTRRLRSSRGFLPDLTPESEYTGELEKFPRPEAMTEAERERYQRWLEYLDWTESHQGAVDAWKATLPTEERAKLNHTPAWDRSSSTWSSSIFDTQGLGLEEGEEWLGPEELGYDAPGTGRYQPGEDTAEQLELF